MNNKIFDCILKNGINQYKIKNSSQTLSFFEKQDIKQGSIFVFRSKEQMSQAKGFVITSQEALWENQYDLTHWTPNVYSWGAYTDKERKVIRGHFNENLKQINTFVVDIDCNKQQVSSGDILLACMDQIGKLPTLILDTPGGYHVYFVLKKPSFVSRANNYKSLRTAMAIANSLKMALAEEIQGVDLGCNSFGIFRFPSEDNICYFDEQNLVSFEHLMSWSMKYKDSVREEIKSIKNPQLAEQEFKQIHSKWFKMLMNQTDVKGTKGVLGRNNVIYTAALACYSSKMDIDDCLNLLDEYNSRLQEPLAHREVLKIVQSAYSGKQKGASSYYISLLTELWVQTEAEKSLETSSQTRFWYKFAKPREERKNSHLHEWEKDLLEFLNKRTAVSKPYLGLTQKKIHEEIGIPLATLKVLLKKLVQEQKIFIKTKRGRGGETLIATFKSLALSLQQKNRYKKELYKQALLRLFPDTKKIVQGFDYPPTKHYIGNLETFMTGWNTS